jgi:hypothetical protein
MALTLAVAPDGSATTAPTTIQDSAGTTRYTLGAGTCSVAPAGGMYCNLTNTEPPGAGPVQIQGRLDAATGSGHGRVAIGWAPTLDSEGAWTATR